MNKTELSTIHESTDDIKLPEISDLTLQELGEILYDFTYPEEFRETVFLRYLEISSDEISDIIFRMIGIYSNSNARCVETFLNKISTNQRIDIIIRFMIGKTIASLKDFGYDILDRLCCEESDKIPIIIKIDAIIFLLQSEKYLENSKKYFIKVIDNDAIESRWRYRTILSLESQKGQNYIDVMRYSLSTFNKNLKNDVRLRILSAQNLLVNFEISPHLRAKTESLLVDILEGDYDDRTKADTADLLLNSGSESSKKTADLVIKQIGSSGKIVDIFSNQENVHTKSISESVAKIVNYLSTIPTMLKEDGLEIDFDYVYHQLETDDLSVMNSLNRISLDRSRYGINNSMISTILIKLYSYIQKSDYTEEMTKRLIEELRDSDNTCSSGNISRIVNVISGFGELSVGISYEDQITAILTRKMNQKANEIPDEEEKEKVLEQMMIPPSRFDERKDFIKFFRESLPNIRQDIYLEFKDCITDTDFDLYFRKALITYDGMN